MWWFIVKWLLLIAGLFKMYMKITTGKCKSFLCMVGKTAIVTGANAGIGYLTALEFAKRGATVILACRNPTLAEEATNRIISETGNKNVSYKILDLSSFESVRNFAKDINATVGKLDILVNNAGVAGVGTKKTQEGNDLTMQVNHLGPFLLTNLLIGLLKKSEPSRIVNVASMGARFAKIDVNDLNRKDPQAYSHDGIMYCNSKLCNILFTRELAKRLYGTKVTTNSLHPGAVFTDIFRRMPKSLKSVFVPLFKYFFKTAEEGAQTTIFLAIDKDVENVSGRHFADCCEVNFYKTVKGPDFAKQIWDASMKATNLREEDLQF